MTGVLPVLIGLAAGVLAGWAMRILLGRLPRGARIPTGLLECAAAVVSATGLALTWGTPRWGLVVWTGLFAVALSAVDLKHHRLPNALTIPGLGVSAAVVLVTEWAAPDTGELLRAVVAGAALFAAFGALSLAVPAAMGRGDVKLVPSLGVLMGYLSWEAMLIGVFAAFALGALASLVGIVSRKLSLRSAIPFGPFLLAGCWLALLFPAFS